MATKDELTDLYVQVRDRAAARKAVFDREDAADKEIMRKVELVLIAKMDAEGEESFRTKHGTAFISSVDFASVAAGDAFFNHVKETGDFDLIERRCSKTGVRAYLDANGTPPPGITYGVKRTLGIRRPPKKRTKRGEANDAPETEDTVTEEE